MFELLNEVVHEAVVEVLTTKMGVTGGRLDLKDTSLNGQEVDIECSSTEIENENIALAVDLLVKTVSGGGSIVGSLMIRRTFMPVMVPASLVACRWESLKER